MSNIDKQALRERYSPKPVPECHICGKEMTIQRMSASRITYGCTGATYDDKGCHYAEGRSIADDHYEQSRVTVVDVSDPDVLALLDELEHYKSREERVTKLVLDNSTSWDALYKKLEAAEKRIAEQSAIVAAAEKLVRCKGRYHSELNYRALAKLFGVVTPDLPPLEHENVHYADAAEVEITALRQRIAELEARKVNLSKLSVGEVMHMSGFSRDYAEGWCAGNDNAIHEIRTAGIKVKGE
ncbi:ead/Ea22-like family protein [Salmonella enterica]|nr:ead/Ea22-like family protein [Salmonella enterica]EBZ4117308.1 ead/Ea22-like family protein [Salmonella enterica subsp. enterica serovar Montevideo]ECN8739985.1 protein Ead [Salmonella enterica subsp. enterica serovar Senftenberg]EDE7845786.1 protein Ead [Salmonella enterica subsp. enterica serovar Oranienburg]EDO5059032.1 protein Ead [Salmonella enterica subsp. enterica serovar Poona]EDV6922333.1 protein Ead [Salmonella enterica subsp. enterica serovar Soerenga]EED2830839.1 protein Ead [S